MIVEDEPAIRELLHLALTRQGYQVEEAQGGRDCIERVSRDSYDLILMDLMMPNWDGRTAIKALAQGKPNAKVMVLTAVKNPEVREALEECGIVVGWAYKPFNLGELTAEIGKILSTKSPG